MKDAELWQRLRSYSFPLQVGDSSLERHLIEKTRLGAAKAARAVEEYRRFLYLAAISGEPVAPSPLIDRVWHTHIQDTRAYVEGFSRDVVGKMIHHSPGRTKAADDPAYQRTLDLYAVEFKEQPFRKVWPSQHWLRGENWRQFALFGTLLGAMFLSPVINFPLPFLAWPVTFGVAIYVDARWGSWSVRASGDGSGCSSCGSGDGGCGGD